MDRSESSAIPRAAPAQARAISVRPSPRHRGTRVKEMAWTVVRRGDEPEMSRLSATRLLRPGRPRSALPGSLSAAARTRRKKPEGARARCARVRCQAHGCAVSEPPERPRVVTRARCPRDRGREGAFLFGYFLLGKHCAAGAARTASRPEGRGQDARVTEVTRRQDGGRNHMDVSRFSQKAPQIKRASKRSMERSASIALTLPSPASGKAENTA